MDIQYVQRGESQVPTRGTDGAAGWDLFAAEEVILLPFKPALVPTNLDIAIPKDHMMLVLPRSGNSLKKNLLIPNSPGLIDEDYRGHLQVILSWMPENYNSGVVMKYKIAKGDRIAQAVLVPYVTQNWVKSSVLPQTARGEAGFGSTGN